MEELKKAIAEALIEAYGDIDDRGANVRGRWLSTEAVYILISDVIAVNDNLFKNEDLVIY